MQYAINSDNQFIYYSILLTEKKRKNITYKILLYPWFHKKKKTIKLQSIGNIFTEFRRVSSLIKSWLRYGAKNSNNDIDSISRN